jgi:hypothetical protein
MNSTCVKSWNEYLLVLKKSLRLLSTLWYKIELNYKLLVNWLMGYLYSIIFGMIYMGFTYIIIIQLYKKTSGILSAIHILAEFKTVILLLLLFLYTGFCISMNYIIFGGLKHSKKSLFLAIGFFCACGGASLIFANILKIFNFHLKYSTEELFTVFLQMTVILFPLGTAIALLFLSINEIVGNNEKEKSTILFLRKFKSKADLYFPGVLASIKGPQRRVQALMSGAFRSIVFYHSINISIIPFFSRALKPFSHNIEHHRSSDKKWMEDVERLIQNASYILVDFTSPSENILKEIEIIKKFNKESVTIFTLPNTSKDNGTDRVKIDFLEKSGFNCKSNLIYHPETSKSVLKWIKFKKKIRMKLSFCE